MDRLTLTEHGHAQRAIIDKLGTGGRIGVAIGVAGSGKRTLLKPLVRAWRDDGGLCTVSRWLGENPVIWPMPG